MSFKRYENYSNVVTYKIKLAKSIYYKQKFQILDLIRERLGNNTIQYNLFQNSHE